MNTVEVSFKKINPLDNFESISNFCLLVLDILKIENWEISILICNDNTIKDLNFKYRNKDESTDVLSFSQDLAVVGDTIYAGDIVVSLETIEQHSRSFNVSIDEELKRVLIHGILHLSGRNHLTNSDDEKMLILQEEILSSISGEKIV